MKSEPMKKIRGKKMGAWNMHTVWWNVISTKKEKGKHENKEWIFFYGGDIAEHNVFIL